MALDVLSKLMRGLQASAERGDEEQRAGEEQELSADESADPSTLRIA